MFYYLFTIYLKVAMVRSNWRGLGCGNWTILGERLVREAEIYVCMYICMHVCGYVGR